MSYKKHLRGVAQYVRGTDRETEVAQASPHRLIQILMETLLGNLMAGKGALERQDLPQATQKLTRAQAIITELRLSLDFEQGGEVIRTLDGLYDFLGRHVAAGRTAADPALIQESIDTFRPIKEAWDAIEEEANKVKPQQETA